MPDVLFVMTQRRSVAAPEIMTVDVCVEPLGPQSRKTQSTTVPAEISRPEAGYDQVLAAAPAGFPHLMTRFEMTAPAALTLSGRQVLPPEMAASGP